MIVISSFQDAHTVDNIINMASSDHFVDGFSSYCEN